MALAPYGSQIVRLYAVDQDQSKNAANKYSLSKIVFHKSDSESRSVPEAFIIEESTGIVRTKEASYLDFVYGYFTMDVSVTGPDGTDPSQVTLYVSNSHFVVVCLKRRKVFRWLVKYYG